MMRISKKQFDNNETTMMINGRQQFINLKQAFIVLLLFCFSYSAVHAIPGVNITVSQPEYATGEYIQSIEDLKIKVQGGEIRIVRTWQDGEWHWNRRWNPIELFGVEQKPEGWTPGSIETRVNPDGSTYKEAVGEPPNLPIGIKRNGASYVWESDLNNEFYAYQTERTYWSGLDKRIELTDTGYIWYDREGNKITYSLTVTNDDETGTEFMPVALMQSYSDRNGNTVELVRDTEGNIQTIQMNGQTLITYSYNGNGQLETISDYSGRAVTYVYNAQGLLETVTDVLGKDWTYTYSASGQISSLTDPTGHKITYNIDDDGVIHSEMGDDGIGKTYSYGYTEQTDQYFMRETDSSGVVTDTWFNAVGYPVRKDVAGETIYTTEIQLSNNSTDVRELIEEDFSQSGSNLQSNSARNPVYIKTMVITRAGGRITRRDYDQWGNIVKTTFPDGNIETQDYDLRYNKPTKVVSEDGTVAELQYDANGNLTQLIEAKGLPEQRTVEYQYDTNGNLTQAKVLADNNTAESAVNYTYDSYGNIQTETDAENNLTQYTSFDALGNLKTSIDARGKNWSNSYDNAGNLISKTDPDNRSHHTEYDEVGRPIKLINAALTEARTEYQGRLIKSLILPSHIGTPDQNSPEGYYIRFEQDPAGRLIQKTNPNGRQTRVNYDTSGRLHKRIDGNANEIAYRYIDNQLTEITYPSYKAVLNYDERDFIISTTIHADNQLRQRRQDYQRIQRKITQTDTRNNETEIHYDALGRINQVVNPNSGEELYQYDDRNNLFHVTDPEGRVTLYEYDANNDLIAIIKQQNNERIEFTYDETGNLKTIITPKNEKTEFFYTDAGLLDYTEIYQQASDTTPQKTINYTYNTVGLLSGYNDGTTSATYSYNARDLLTQTIINYGAFSKTYSYDYYPNGRKKSYTNPEGITYTYDYDGNNQLQSIQIPGEGQYTVNEYDWLAPSKITLPGGALQELIYDDTLRLIERLYKDPGQNTQHQANYTYDFEDNVKTQNTEHGNYTYNYDELGRLISADNPEGLDDEAYTYDKVGNRLSTAISTQDWQYNNNNQLTQTDTASYTYDANGSLSSKTESGQTLDYIFNAEQRLERVEDNNQQIIAEYSYDPFGRRISKTINSVTTYYLYSQEGLAAEYDNSGNLITEYHYAPNNGKTTYPIFLRHSNTIYYYHNDRLGAPQALYTKTGQLKWLAKFNAFGEAQIIVNDIQQNLRLPGQYFDSETDLHYNIFRYYDPSLGRYISSDPLGLASGLNFYWYANANPINFIDPLGLYCFPQGVHDGLDAAGLFPGAGIIPDLANAGLYAIEGDWGNFGFALAAAIPGIGQGATAAKHGKKIADDAADIISKNGDNADDIAKEIEISRKKYGEAAEHIDDAQKAGHPDVLTIDRGGASANRKDSIGDLPKVPEKQLDEYPPAMFKEGGTGASVRPIDPSDNMGAGACIGNACRGLADGEKVRIKVVD